MSPSSPSSLVLAPLARTLDTEYCSAVTNKHFRHDPREAIPHKTTLRIILKGICGLAAREETLQRAGIESDRSKSYEPYSRLDYDRSTQKTIRGTITYFEAKHATGHFSRVYLHTLIKDMKH
jgi:hypothetical protein